MPQPRSLSFAVDLSNDLDDWVVPNRAHSAAMLLDVRDVCESRDIGEFFL